MSRSPDERAEAQGRAWRDPHAVVAQWSDAGATDPELLEMKAHGGWWEALAEAGVTLVVSREYEHLLLAISAVRRPRVSYLRLPHPSGIAFDRARDILYVASTRNPNAIFEFERASQHFLPMRANFLPGSLYIHDLAIIGTRLHANAVGRNAVVELGDCARAVWWPAALERDGAPRADHNYIQLNSIAAGADLAGSFFTASSERPGRLRPGDPKYPVDRRGVVFSGATRRPVVRGLTRPHSARLRGARLWLDNSGYGEVGVVAGEAFEPIARLEGWTRGLGFAGRFAFVGTSRVIPRFKDYAPGLDCARSICALHALDATTGRTCGSLEFPSGNQIFAIEPVPNAAAACFPFHRSARPAAIRDLFYAYERDP